MLPHTFVKSLSELSNFSPVPNVADFASHTQAEYEQYTIDQGREVEAQHQQHKIESHALKMRVQDLEGSFADATRDEEVTPTDVTVPPHTTGCLISRRRVGSPMKWKGPRP